MSLKVLYHHLLLYVRTQTVQIGNHQLCRACRGSDVYSHAVSYLKNALGGLNIDYSRLALAACNDLVALRLITVYSSSSRGVFSKRPTSYMFLHARSPSSSARLKSGLRWT